MTNDRYVAPTGIDANNSAAEARALLCEGMEGLVALDFAPEEYVYFRVEYARSGRDVVMHFFVTERQKTAWTVDFIERWWLNDFAEALDITAKEHFQAELPRIMAKYTEEMASWWFKAQGYDHIIDLVGFLRAFFSKLDETLRNALGHAPAQ